MHQTQVMAVDGKPPLCARLSQRWCVGRMIVHVHLVAADDAVIARKQLAVVVQCVYPSAFSSPSKWAGRFWVPSLCRGIGQTPPSAFLGSCRRNIRYIRWPVMRSENWLPTFRFTVQQT